MDTPQLVAAIRRATRQSQEELARELGVSFASVNAWENGRTEPRDVHRALLESRAHQLGILHDTRVLVIDDEPADCRFAELVIGEVAPDVEVLTATNGSRGLLMCGRLSPAIVLLDVRMPGISGLDVARSFGRVDGLQDIDLYFLTGADTEDLEATVDEIGVAGVISKPLTGEDVRRVLERAGHATPVD